jgi:hypothetical protein
MAGAEGPHCSRRELRALLQQGQRARALCKPWLPTAGACTLNALAELTQNYFDDLAGRWPAAEDSLPADMQLARSQLPAKRYECAACGQDALHLRRCSACRAVSYCSPECQRRHWKEGGHKQQCPQLAAARGGSSGGGSGSR